MMAEDRTSQGRGVTEVVGRMREAISAGRYGGGRFLPPVRKLSSQHKVSPETVRRGLKVLEAEGLVVAEARQGFRVAARPVGGDVGRCPVAYVTSYDADLASAQPANLAIMGAFQRAMAEAGSAVLGAHAGGRGGELVVEQLKAGRAWGVALDTMDRALLETLRGSGLPLVLVNSCWEDVEVDAVLQDNYRGGFLAAKHLLDSGCRRIGWLGAVGKYYHSRERYAGATAALAAAGRRFEEALCVEAEGAELEAKARQLLRRANRPDGVLAFSSGAMSALVRAGRELGIRLGGELKAVGWVVEESYGSEYLPLFAGDPVLPAVTWKAASMAERAMALLAERRAGRAGEPVRVCVPTRLKFAER
jgi:DNA-binding LacI/PurR family transcriptional regulator